MARGQNALSHIDFSQPIDLEGNPLVVKGRSPELLRSRDSKIIARYYYHNALKKIDYGDTIKLLIMEFDLKERTISTVLKKNAGTIIEMRKKNVSASLFKKQWYWLRW